MSKQQNPLEKQRTIAHTSSILYEMLSSARRHSVRYLTLANSLAWPHKPKSSLSISRMVEGRCGIWNEPCTEENLHRPAPCNWMFQSKVRLLRCCRTAGWIHRLHLSRLTVTLVTSLYVDELHVVFAPTTSTFPLAAVVSSKLNTGMRTYQQGHGDARSRQGVCLRISDRWNPRIQIGKSWSHSDLRRLAGFNRSTATVMPSKIQI